MNTPKAKYFKNASEFRTWLRAHHQSAEQLWVGYFKVASGRPSMTWSQSVDEALCFGWIDGVRKSVDEERYAIRFTPRKKGSVWSAVNVAKMATLEASGRMSARGREAFAARNRDEAQGYSYATRPQRLPGELRKILDADRRAAVDFDARPPSYRRAAIWWVVSAKTEATRTRRLQTLIHCHAQAKTIPPLTPRAAKTTK